VGADVVLETDRLALRRFTEADAELLFELDSDPEVMRYIGPYALPDVAAYRDRIRSVWLPRYAHPPQAFLAAVEKPNGAFVGWFFLRQAPDYKFAAEVGWTRTSDLELGYRLRRAAWGRGLATEAATALVRTALADPEVTGVVAAALVPNRASWRVMEKVGMSRVGAFAVPGFTDPLVTYARLREGDGPPGVSDAG
jgi:RimJ/RimL family protein N-acetyltransferase